MVNKLNNNFLIFDEDSPLFIKKKLVVKERKSNLPKYIIKTPYDCKYILPASKEKLFSIWKTLESGTSIQARNVPNYIRGLATVAKVNNPKEYEELKLLIIEARCIVTEKYK